MAITPLDANTALVIIDLQKGLASYPTVHPIDDVVRHSAALAAAFRRHHLPVVLVNVDGGAPGRTQRPAGGTERSADWLEFITALDRQPQDHVVTKRTWGAFTNTGLEAHLKRLNVTQIVLAGVATSIGVESTARSAGEHSYELVIPEDLCSCLSAETHAFSFEYILPRLARITTSESISFT